MRRSWLASTGLALLAALVQAAPAPGISARDAEQGSAGGILKAYVAATDPSTGWTERSRGDYRGASYRELVLTSQTWRGSAWKHQLFILHPANAEPGRPALLFVAGGNWRPSFGRPPDQRRVPEGTARYAALADKLRAPVAVLLQVPFQPMFGQLREDDLIAFSFDQYLQTGRTDWPLLLPMVKAVVTAMDALDDVLLKEWALPPSGFLVTGASKRGWTIWLAAATDARIVAFAPMVFDMLDIDRQLAHQEATFGFAAPEMGAYTARQLPQRLQTPAGQALLGIVDPWQYRADLVQPKLVILATNDANWPADASAVYWDGLPGPRNILYLPNDRHSPDGLPRLRAGLVALHRSVARGGELPQVHWDFAVAARHAELRLTASATEDGPALRARAWVALAPTRDFRGAQWRARPMARQPDGSFRYQARLPGQGFLGMFGEVGFGQGARRFDLSTGLRLFDRDRVLPVPEE
jgi:PhoPQ-activated pathogenicity-related protein